MSKKQQNPGRGAEKVEDGPQPLLRFCDIFAGCGGLSLGLVKAGCQGTFAIEKSPLAFETLRHNLVDGARVRFQWPTWLPKAAMTCEELIEKHSDEIGKLVGQVDLIVGGPPCQGFSLAGKRNPADPRNKMTEQYLSLVGLIKPTFLVIENVSGFDMEFDDDEGALLEVEEWEKHSYAEHVAERLRGMGYQVNAGLVNCADFGVPQRRFRFLMICERTLGATETPNLLMRLKQRAKSFRHARGLSTRGYVSVRSAISDLETAGRVLVPSNDSPVRGFMEAEYRGASRPTAFQKLMRDGVGDAAPNSRRLANHKQTTIEYFRKVQSVCRPGYSLSVNERRKVGTRKHSTTVLGPNRPAPTITTLPDDIIHYSEPRILTVRENARIQSFPDWFEFRGKYTTGGKQRKQECPRYTQVGNAVPPLLAEAIGEVLLARVSELETLSQLEAVKLKRLRMAPMRSR